MKIGVVGSNLQAGVLTALLSEYGNEVFVFPDRLEDRGITLQDEISLSGSQSNSGHYQRLQDPQLETLLQKHFQTGSFKFLTNTVDLPEDIECYLLCYEPNRLADAARFITALPKLPAGKKRLWINSGTFGLYGTEKLQKLVPTDHWVYLPDTIQEGNAINSFLKANKIIFGIDMIQDDVKVLVKELFRPFFPLESHYLWMPILDAELAKLSISGMLATRISYMNDLANVAEKIGVDILNVKQGLAADNRIGSSYLSPGVGFGGENFSHDILMLSSLVSESGVRGRLLEQVWAINEDQKEVLFRKLWRFYHTDLTDKHITIWGASFKEETASTYNSPIHKMITALVAQGAYLHLYDPEANDEIALQYPELVGTKIRLFDDKYEALKASDAVCILTSWKEFYSPNYDRMMTLMKTPLILDGRNIYDPEFMKAKGFMYEGVGRI